MSIPTFNDMIRGSYDFNEEAFKSDHRWEILRNLYNLNHLMDIPFPVTHIPKVIHQIWLGGEVPDKYIKWIGSWEALNPTWRHVLWTDNDLILLGNMMTPSQYEILNSITNLGQKSDFLRYHILRSFGGVYVDTDFECLQSFDPLTKLSFFTGVGFPSHPELYIGIIGSAPHHPIIERICTDMTEVRGGGWREIFDTTGAYFFTKKFFEVVGEFMDGVVAYPTDFFYPFPNQSGHEKKNGRDFIKPHSLAVHHWAVSWSKKK